MYRFLTFVKKWQLPIQTVLVILMGIAAGQFGGWGVRALLVKDLSVPPPVPTVSVKDEDEDKLVPLEYFNPVTERNLMMIDVSMPKAPAPGEAGALDAASLQRSNLSLELMGTIAGPERVALAVIRAKANQNVDVFRVGDKVFNQATVIKIERMRVVLDRGGQVEVLEIEEEGKPAADGGGVSRIESPAPASASPGDSTAPGNLEVREVDQEHFEIDRAGFESVVSDLAPLLTQARVVPHFEEGKLTGYKIFAIKQGSVYEKIGLRNGDVLVSVNGNVIDDPTKAMQLLTQLKTEDEFKIDLARGGKQMTFRYNLR